MCSDKPFEFPDCWKDDTRMNVLFAPFRSKAINPTDWESKMKFWEMLIEKWCKFNKRVVLSQSELLNEFQRNGKTPACFSEVVENLNRNGILISKDKFYQMMEQSWKNWAVQIMVTNPLKWTLNKLKSTVITPVNSNEFSFIHLPTIKHLGESLIKSIPEEFQGKLIDIHYVSELMNMNTIEELMLVLQYVQSQQLLAMLHDSKPILIKFSNGVKPVRINEIDIGIYKLEQHEKSLKTNIEKLELEKESALNEARKYVAAKMKMLAKNSLRKKKEIEKYIEKRTTALDNIQNLLYKIKQAESDSEVLNSYKLGINALKQTFKETGLTESNAAGTMDDLEDVLDVHKEIEAELSRSLDDISDRDLEDELEKLLSQDASDTPPENPSDISHNLPDVPKESPSWIRDSTGNEKKASTT